MGLKIRSASQYLGFKQTPIGKIPEDWEVVKLGNISAQRNDIVKPEQKGVIRFVGLEHIDPGKTNIRDYCSDLNIKSSKFQFSAGDILYGKLRPYLDKAVITDFDGICSTDLIVINSNRSKTFQKFLIHLVHSKDFINYAISNTSGTNHPRTSWKAIANFKFGLPPLPEQQKIAEILATVDEVIEKVDEAVKKTQRLKKGLMQELLTNGIGHKEFKDTEIGRIPKEWDIEKLEDISLNTLGGGTPSTSNAEYWDGEIAWMTSAHISDREISTGQRYITEQGLKNSSSSVVPKDNLIIATRVGIGKAAINKIDISISQDLTGVIINKNKSIPEFLYWMLIKNKNNIKSLAQGSTIKGILREELMKIKIPLPPLSEQQKIAEILGTVDSRMEMLRKRKGKIERIKKGLMNDLLTGRKRVKLDS